jgi:diacylglycerol kinase (ATP)
LLRLWRATINTRNGLAFAIRSEQAVREELVALVLSLPAAWLVGVTAMRSFQLVAAVAFVLVVELLNTAVEKLADRLTTDHDPQIGRVKDMGSSRSSWPPCSGCSPSPSAWARSKASNCSLLPCKATSRYE